MSEVITLKYPITVNGQEITSLSLRRPKVRDMLVADKSAASSAEQEMNLFANLCEVDNDTILELDAADYKQLQETYSNFLS